MLSDFTPDVDGVQQLSQEGGHSAGECRQFFTAARGRDYWDFVRVVHGMGEASWYQLGNLDSRSCRDPVVADSIVDFLGTPALAYKTALRFQDLPSLRSVRLGPSAVLRFWTMIRDNWLPILGNH